jgi:diazepam-binding inhibitor (GABA receptor modulating acyl-CoA-binding protein)
LSDIGVAELGDRMGLEEDFTAAAEDISNNVNKTISNDELKQVYALYKQATVGDVDTARPGMLDLKGKAKWDAWNAVKGMGREEAKQKYIALATQLKEKHGVKE